MEEEAAQPELTDEELEAQALAAEAAEEAVIVVPVEEQAEEDRSGAGKTDQRRFLRAPEAQPAQNQKKT